LTLEQVLNDGRLSVGRDSKFKNSFARQRIIDLDLNSIEFNTPPPEQESALFNEFQEMSRITHTPAQPGDFMNQNRIKSNDRISIPRLSKPAAKLSDNQLI